MLRQRLGHLDADAIAAMDVEEFVAVCCEKPAIHRFPAAMGRRIHELCTVLAAEYDGHADERLGRRRRPAPSCTGGCARCRATATRRRRSSSPSSAKTQGVAPDGWREAAGKFGDDVPRSVADISGPESLARVREWKRAQKAAKRDKQDRPA